MLNGYVETQLLYVAAALGLADLLHDEPRGVDELARAMGADRDALRRVLRGPTNSGIVDEGEDGRFALTELGEPLRADAPGSLRALVLLTGAQEYRAWGELPYTTRTGQTAFERAYGELFFARLDHDPAIGAHFDAFMDRVSARIAAALPAAYDFSPFRSVVDVGGGRGTLLAALLAAYPRLHGTLFDRAAVLSDVPQALVTAGVTARCQVVAGDFFQAVPAGGDLYILSQVLHDWNDARAARILSNCRRAMGAAGTLLIIERIMPGRVVLPEPIVTSDLHMLALTGGRERTEEEYHALLTASGFALTRATSLVVGWSLMEGMPR